MEGMQVTVEPEVTGYNSAEAAEEQAAPDVLDNALVLMHTEAQLPQVEPVEPVGLGGPTVEVEALVLVVLEALVLAVRRAAALEVLGAIISQVVKAASMVGMVAQEVAEALEVLEVAIITVPLQMVAQQEQILKL